MMAGKTFQGVSSVLFISGYMNVQAVLERLRAYNTQYLRSVHADGEYAPGKLKILMPGKIWGLMGFWYNLSPSLSAHAFS